MAESRFEADGERVAESVARIIEQFAPYFNDTGLVITQM